jgi:FtsZ-binding cell division protein ZapB
MTANELADKLDEIYTGTDYEDIKLAATMLRQQEAELNEAGHMICMLRWEIEELKERLEETRQLYIKQLALQKLSDISQEIENEPVAWMLLGLEDRKPKLINLQVIEHLEGTWIPLYTHPMCKLTDEEIGQFKGQWYRGDFNSFYDLVQAILKKYKEIEK